MPIPSPTSSDLAAYREAIISPFPQVVGALAGAISKKLTAYIAGVKDVRALDRWIAGAAPYRNAEERLRFAWRVVRTLQSQDQAPIAQSWLTGLNPELDDRAPIRLLREGDLEKVGPALLAAARAFASGG
jgi:hypothetical protein